MLGNRVEVITNEDEKIKGILKQKDPSGVIIGIQTGFARDDHDIFFPMHKISKIIDKGPVYR